MTVTEEKNISVITVEPSIEPSERPAAESAYASAAKKESSQIKSSHSNMGVWIVLLLLIAGLIYASWYFVQQSFTQQELLSRLQEQIQQQQQAAQLQQKTLMNTLHNQFAEQDQAVQETMNDLAQRVDTTAARVLSMASVTREDWKLAEAEYLLRLANQRVLLDRNSGNAVALAKTVDEILHSLNDPDLFPIRKALASEIGSLSLAGDIDREGVYLRLMALSEQIEKLPMVEPLGATDDEWLDVIPEENETWGEKIKRGFNRILFKLGHHVRLRDHAEPVEAILPPNNQIYLKQNMRLILEQAQSALLREEPQIYDASLEKAKEWLKMYFPLNTKTLTVQSELEELQGVIISQTLPNFSESSELLKNYTERKHKLSVSRQGGK